MNPQNYRNNYSNECCVHVQRSWWRWQPKTLEYAVYVHRQHFCKSQMITPLLLLLALTTHPNNANKPVQQPLHTPTSRHTHIWPPNLLYFSTFSKVDPTPPQPPLLPMTAIPVRVLNHEQAKTAIHPSFQQQLTSDSFVLCIGASRGR